MRCVDKINSHEKMNLQDLREFTLYQADKLDISEYVRDVEIKEFLSCFITSATAGYSQIEKKVVIDPNIDSKFAYRSYKSLFDGFSLDYNDFHNLYLMRIVFHELWHAQQQKAMEGQMDSEYLALLRFFNIVIQHSGTCYRVHHDRYYHEYDANVHSMLLTTEFMQEYDFNKTAISIINRIFASDILQGYGIDRFKRWEYYERKAPILFIDDLVREMVFLRNDYEPIKPIVEKYTKTINPKPSFNSLVIGDRIPYQTREFLVFVRDSFIESTNLIEGIKTSMEGKRYIKC